jgi:hypothetical protein
MTVAALIAWVSSVGYPPLPTVAAQTANGAPAPAVALDCVEEAAALGAELPYADGVVIHRCACARGRAESCAAVASATWSGPARRTYETRACDAGLLSSCVRAARLAEEESQTAEAQALDERACNAGSGEACHLLARLTDADRFGAPRDPSRSLELLERACDLEWWVDCASAASRLAGHDGAADARRATELFARGCKGGGRGCIEAAERLRDGVGSSPDAPRALEAFQVTCPDATTLPTGPLKPCRRPPARQLREGTTTVDPRLSPALLYRLTEAQLPLLKACWAGWPGERRHAHAALHFVVDRASKAHLVALDGAENVEPEMEACMRRAFTRFVYPLAEAGVVTVTYPIVFDYGG